MPIIKAENIRPELLKSLRIISPSGAVVPGVFEFDTDKRTFKRYVLKEASSTFDPQILASLGDGSTPALTQDMIARDPETDEFLWEEVECDFEITVL